VRAALIFSLEPVAAALFSHLYGGEPLGPADWLGGGLIALGVVAGEVGGALEARGEAAAAARERAA
jgi:drug/metabolite transporter (DMT)-like permease